MLRQDNKAPMRPADYMRKLRPLTKTGSDYALAKLLGVTEQAVYRYNSNESRMDNSVCLRVAELLHMQLEKVITDMEIDRAKDEKTRKKWQQHCHL